MARILFSPIGSTDPVSGMHDGALLHIIRTYKPDRVVLYLSKEICELEEKDGRYSYCLDRIEELIKHKFERRFIKREDLVDVHVFDFFLTEFREILAELYSEDDEILLNVSSGTPAMKSALQVLSTLFDRPLRPVQVSTPAKEINRHEDVKGDYSVELQWEYNIDNDENYVDRCTESSVLNFNIEIKKNVIKRHISVYDYVAALRVADTIDEYLPDNATALLRAGVARLKMDRPNCEKYIRNTGYDMYPVKQGDKWQIFEYLMLLYIKIRKEEYADYIRAISPVFFELMETIIVSSGLLDLNAYTIREKTANGKFIKKWNADKAVEIGREISNLKIDKNRIINSEDYFQIIRAKNNNSRVNKLVLDIRSVEKKIRNTAAHTITHITDEDIKSVTGSDAMSIFKKLLSLAKEVGVPLSDDELRTYDKLNEEIIRQLG